MTQATKLESGDGHTFDAHFVRPEGVPRGALVVVQEIFGVNAHIREVCDRYAAEGWVAVAPALFDRAVRGIELDYTAEGVERGLKLRSGITIEDTLMDVAAAAEAAATDVGGAERVAVVGFCWGGSIAAAAACRLGGVCAAAVGYYGGQITDLLDEQPEVPLLLHFGEVDRGIPLADVDRIRAAWPTVGVHVHGGADHGFNCDVRGSHHPEAAAHAAELTEQFLAATL